MWQGTALDIAHFANVRFEQQLRRTIFDPLHKYHCFFNEVSQVNFSTLILSPATFFSPSCLAKKHLYAYLNASISLQKNDFASSWSNACEFDIYVEITYRNSVTKGKWRFTLSSEHHRMRVLARFFFCNLFVYFIMII